MNKKEITPKLTPDGDGSVRSRCGCLLMRRPPADSAAYVAGAQDAPNSCITRRLLETASEGQILTHAETITCLQRVYGSEAHPPFLPSQSRRNKFRSHSQGDVKSAPASERMHSSRERSPECTHDTLSQLLGLPNPFHEGGRPSLMKITHKEKQT